MTSSKQDDGYNGFHGQRCGDVFPVPAHIGKQGDEEGRGQRIAQQHRHHHNAQENREHHRLHQFPAEVKPVAHNHQNQSGNWRSNKGEGLAYQRADEGRIGQPAPGQHPGIGFAGADGLQRDKEYRIGRKALTDIHHGKGAGLTGAEQTKQRISQHAALKVQPNMENHAVYEEMYAVWRKVYDAQLALSDEGTTRYRWVAPGQLIHIEPGEIHYVLNRYNKPVKMISVLAPCTDPDKAEAENYTW